jgi:hypothetical protein
VARGIVFDEEAARDIERCLRQDGYAATVGRERYAGEDDDEDHAWVVTTDAPVVAVDLLLERHDGWLDEEPADVVPEPVELPDAPRRRHRE